MITKGYVSCTPWLYFYETVCSAFGAFNCIYVYTTRYDVSASCACTIHAAMNPSMFSLHQCQALRVALPTKCCVGIATCNCTRLSTMVNVHYVYMCTPTLQAGQEASGTEAALQAAILNVYTPCCVVRQSCNAQDCLFYQLDSLFATLAPHLSL